MIKSTSESHKPTMTAHELESREGKRGHGLTLDKWTERSALWEEKLQFFAKVMAIKLDMLPASRSAEPKVQLAAAMKQTTSVSNLWLTQRLGMGEPASVSQYVRRFRLRGGLEERVFR